MKNFEISLIFCCWLLVASQCDAETANCEYKFDDNWLSSGLKNRTVSGYICDLLLDSRNSVEVTDIAGRHQAERADDDVKILWNYRSNLKTFSSIFCEKFNNLEIIRIQNIEIGAIDENSLRGCKNLEVINLRGNKLREVPEKLLVENSKLTQVRIWENVVTTLPENFLQNQSQLEQLFLYHNQISFLPTKIFHPLVNLQYLNLANNKLQVLDPEWFVGLKSLKWISLFENQIAAVPGGIFKSLKSLDKLRLWDNRIKILSPESFEGLQNLKELHLYKNEISELPRGVFVPLKNLEWLSLYSNMLTVIDSDSFGSHNNLIQIDLQDNKISALDEKIIDNTAVKFLSMANNLCFNGNIQARNEMKVKVQNCFRHQRTQPTLSPRSNPVKPSQSTQSSIIQILTQQQSQSTLAVCGTSMVGTGNIIGGTHITRNAFPWIAALVQRTNGDFFCGGTLVTEKKIVTAAHCIQEKGESMPILKTYFYVLLGVHDLKATLEPGRTAYVVETINMHHDWDSAAEKFDADIAVLVLEQTVFSSRYIQPICLIEPTSNIASITNGIVVGFGKSEDQTKLHENIPKIIDTPIVDADTCFVTNYRLARFSSLRTFCGGTGNGTGVCKGDSGSGLFVKHGDVLYLRGIVSSSLFTHTNDCDVNTYSIFTDMLKFNDWVNGI